MKNLFCVKDRVVVVTGACGVLGESAVKHFVGQGAKVVMLDLEQGRERAGQIIRSLEGQEGEAIFLPTNVLDRA